MGAGEPAAERLTVTTDGIFAQAAKHIFHGVGDWLAASPQDVNLADEKGFTVLHYAAAAESAGHDVEDIVNMLLQAGADPHQVNGAGDTPFNVAAANAPVTGRLLTNHWLEQALMKRGKGLNERSGSHGSTLAQYMAKWSRDDEIEKQLREAVEAGMQPDLANASGWTPVTAAAAMGRVKAVEAFIWHYDFKAATLRTVDEYVATYNGQKVVYAAGLDAAEVAFARLTQDQSFSAKQKNDYAKIVAIIVAKISGS
ncbi:MAG: ankyrin repeat domain-containing protein [bacterium]|nr:ankyrin repeat domain-containing protein [bacterium]